MNWYIILFFIVAITLYAITHYLRVKQDNRLEKEQTAKKELEHFQNELNLTPTDKLAKHHNILTISFKNADEARKLIKPNAPYLQQMNKPNLIARDCASPAELVDKYQNAFDDITQQERTVVTKFILELLEKIKPHNLGYYKYLCYWVGRISIAKAKPWLEAGMPHTLEDTIIMDANWFKTPRANTFVHELTHVHQRIVPFEFEEIYKDLHYIEYKSGNNAEGVENIRGMGAVVALNRNNPDGLSANWLWVDNGGTRWWIGAVFNNITPSSLLDVKNVALKLEQDGDGTLYYLKQNPMLLNEFREFNKFFGDEDNSSPNNYHPNEMSAKFGEWLLEYYLGNASGNKYNCNGFNIYRKYFEKLMNTFYSG